MDEDHGLQTDSKILKKTYSKEVNSRQITFRQWTRDEPKETVWILRWIRNDLAIQVAVVANFNRLSAQHSRISKGVELRYILYSRWSSSSVKACQSVDLGWPAKYLLWFLTILWLSLDFHLDREQRSKYRIYWIATPLISYDVKSQSFSVGSPGQDWVLKFGPHMLMS